MDEDTEGFEINDIKQFQDAYTLAIMKRQSYIEVGPKVFNWFMKGEGGKYFTYGNPTIRVYLVGHREEVERQESRKIL